MRAHEPECAHWLHECRSKLHWGRQLQEVEDWLDCSLELLREILMQAWGKGMTPEKYQAQFIHAMDALTSLRYSNPYNCQWIHTALPEWGTCSGPTTIPDETGLKTVLSVIHFLDSMESNPERILLDWALIQMWIFQLVSGQDRSSHEDSPDDDGAVLGKSGLEDLD